MRRHEIGDALKDSIEKHFPDDVASQFNLNDLDHMAKTVQARDDINDASDVADLVEKVVGQADGKELDEIADGDVRDPNAWLTTRLWDI